MRGWGATGWGEAVVGVCWGAGWWHALFGPTVEMASALGAGSVCPSFGSSIGGPSSWGGMWGWSARRESGCGVSHREGLVPFLFSSRGVFGVAGAKFFCSSARFQVCWLRGGGFGSGSTWACRSSVLLDASWWGASSPWGRLVSGDLFRFL